MRGSFDCKDNVAPAISTRSLIAEPASFDYAKLAHPPVTFRHEKLKGDERIPAARRYIVEHGLNETFEGRHADLGVVVQGGLYNSLIRALQQFGLADAFGASAIPLLVLNVTCPLVPEQLAAFCIGKRGVLVVEEGQPEYIEQEIATLLRRREARRRCTARTCCRRPPKYSIEVLAEGLLRFAGRYLPGPTRRQSSAGSTPTAAACRGARPVRAAAAGAATRVLHRLPRAAGVRGAEAGAAGDRQGPHRGRHRLPCLRHVRAVLVGALDPRLRHEPRERAPAWRR